MYQISIISSSIRTDRKSHNVALYLEKYINDNKLAKVEIIDLKQFDFPIFEERLKFQNKPSLEALEFKNKIIASDGIIIVSPEYNGSIPASLKNVIDLLYEEWQGKTIAFSTVSSGEFGGLQALTHLEFVFKKIGALVDLANFSISKVQDMFDDFGVPTNKKKTDELAKIFIEEFIKWIKSNK
ncbi:MAG: NAD(P)H-dependent oxidoreductase [Flavobacterium sp.]|uniref:NADPH-dependent FMN reductase n=1 Tax=Flavobacterium sp. TaxID=239 RepID=UPI0022BE36D8|nr:NAD(P)H-dependent oxidoreductase [Flavobacterium sp.]MCZ8196287.1 NAD(P)H-dependent oxidoreductase [Flavobacterium sp.]